MNVVLLLTPFPTRGSTHMRRTRPCGLPRASNGVVSVPMRVVSVPRSVVSVPMSVVSVPMSVVLGTFAAKMGPKYNPSCLCYPKVYPTYPRG